MKISKTEGEPLVPLLKKLSALAQPLLRTGERDWASDTIKTLHAGKLEDCDLTEFAVAEFQTKLEGREDKRPVWDYSRALLALLEELERRRIVSDRSRRAREELAAWTDAPL